MLDILPAMARKHFRGGKNLKKFIAKAKAAKPGVKSVKVGVFGTSTYADDNSTPVALVAMVNEFGSEDGHIPERPAFRNGNASFKERATKQLAREIDPTTMVVTEDMANRLGLAWQAEIQAEVVRIRNPPNAPSTIRDKKSSNPLVGKTSTLIQSITYSVET